MSVTIVVKEVKMEAQEFQEPKKSRRALWIILAVFVVILLAAGAAYALIAMNNKPKTQETASSPSPKPQVTLATKEQVSENLSSLSDSVKQMSADQAAAKAAMTDAKNQIKAND